MKKQMTYAGVLVLIAVMACSVALAKEHIKKRKMQLPEDVKATLTQQYPGASVQEIELEEVDVKIFEVKLLLESGIEIEVMIAADGTVMEMENELEAASLPFDVSSILPAGAKVLEAESKVTYAVLMPVILEQPQTTYELEAVINGQTVEFEIAADGTILSREIDDDDEDQGHHGNHDDDDDGEDVEVSINDVPDAVKQTILAESQGGQIEEIELENEDGNVFYEAEVIIDGQEIELKIAVDGTLLEKEIEDDDEDEDDD